MSIQEVYEDAHAQFLTLSLIDMYPYSSREYSGGCTKFHNGLLFLSKYPVERSELQKLNKVAGIEAALATKSNLIMCVDIPSIGKITLVNMHTTAGGATHPEDPGCDTDREDELRQAIEVCTEVASKEGHVGGIIIGDLNCGPEASPANYAYVLDQGFRDVYVEAQEAGNLLDGPAFSWDPTNYLNEIGPHKDCPGQRCDHVLLTKNTGFDEWTAKSAQIIFSEKFIDIGKKMTKGGHPVLSTMSDHHALVVELKR